MRDTESLTMLLETLQTVQAGSRALDMRVVSELGLADSHAGVLAGGEVICFRLRPTGSTDPHMPWLPGPSPTQSIDHAWALAQLVLQVEDGLSIIQMRGQKIAQAEIVKDVFTEASTVPLAILATTVEALIGWKRAEGSGDE